MKCARNIPWSEKLEKNELPIAKMRKTMERTKIIYFLRHQMLFLENIKLELLILYIYTCGDIAKLLDIGMKIRLYKVRH